MFQEFFTDTLASRYIKTLLQETPLPVFDCVNDGDTLVSGCYYVYKQYIIQCHTGGILAVDVTEKLYPSTTLYPSQYLYPKTGYRAATFYVKSIVDINDSKIMSTYRSTSNYYDSETHKQLGRYLRYLKTRTSLNLMPFYNCYSHHSFPNIQLVYRDNERNEVGDMNTRAVINENSSEKSVQVVDVVTQTHKLVAVPILFGKKYTIAIDCSSQVLMKAVIYGSKLNKLATSLLENSWRIYGDLRFDSPVTFSIETTYPEILQQQRNLWLLIQLPKSHDSSIVVLEDFKQKRGIYTNKDAIQEFDFLNPSLLYMSSNKSFAFSNRLVEYLLDNVISTEETITNNIQKIQTALSQIRPLASNKYRERLKRNDAYLGIWDEQISQEILKHAHAYSKDNFILDQDGNVNKDVEQLILRKGVNY